MKRKIIKQANQAFTLTLPIGWVRKNNLDKKDSEVDIEESEKSLIIRNKGHIETKKGRLDLSNLNIPRVIGARISALYATGFDELEIISNKDISNIIIQSLKENIGYALVAKESQKYIIKDISGATYSDLDEILKRVYQVILMFYDSAIEDIFGEEKEDLDSLNLKDKEINKFCLFLQRAINKMAYPNLIAGRIIFAYSVELEKIGDEIHRLWRTNIENKIKKSEKIREIINISREALSKSFELYFNLNKEAAEEIVNLKIEIRNKLMKMKILDANTARFLGYALKITEDAADLIHLILMKNSSYG